MFYGQHIGMHFVYMQCMHGNAVLIQLTVSQVVTLLGISKDSDKMSNLMLLLNALAT